MDYEAPRVGQRTEVSAPLNTANITPSQTPGIHKSPRWRSSGAGERAEDS